MFVKICGLSTEETVDAAVAAGADAVGFVLTESPRRISPARAAELARRLPPHVLAVAVFRRQPVDEVRAALDESGLPAAQLHGGEGPEMFQALRSHATVLVRGTVAGAPGADAVGSFGEDILLVDAPTPGEGRAWDASPASTPPGGGRWMLAGGLAPQNVADAVTRLRPWGVDVSSGVESRRGIKDPALIGEFVAAARTVA